MSNATLVAGLRTAIANLKPYGAAGAAVVTQNRGGFDPATGRTAAPEATSIELVYGDEEVTTSNDGGQGRTQTVVAVYDDIPNTLTDDDYVTIREVVWNVVNWTIDPTQSVIEIELAR